jgi:hypothetical protein
MSKESVERGLGVRVHGGPEKREKAKREERIKRGRFVPDAQDVARLRFGVRGAMRRA